MPELAEVEFFRKQWDCGLGQKIIAVQLHPRKRIFRGIDTRKIVEQLTGRRFLRSYARGKQMLFEFSAGNWIGIHLGMSGKLRTEPAGFRPEKHDHFVLQQTQQALFSAMRVFLDECDFIMAGPSRPGGAREDPTSLPTSLIAGF